MSKLLFIPVLLTLTSCAAPPPCTPVWVEAKVESVYYQPRSYGAAWEKWTGNAVITTEGPSKGKSVTYEVYNPVMVGHSVGQSFGCGYFESVLSLPQ